MAFKSEISIAASPAKIWNVITDIENSDQFISGIQSLEILEKPDQGLVGLKWEETRIMFGQTATETMWITDVKENRYYKTRAERPGVVYITTLSLEENGDSTDLSMELEAEISTFGARLMSSVMGIFFNKATLKALQKDLEDIKAAVEGQ